jgi:lipid II:glycine glycyltransferase (peptidoglycan interpeptide bridge formation enzyme)
VDLDVQVTKAASDPEWDAWVAATPGGHHVQTSGWAHVKAAAGLRATRVLLRRDGELVGGCQMLVRRLPLVGNLAYLPRGPLLGSREPELADAMLAAVRRVARRERIVFLKIQPPVDRADLAAALEARGMVSSELHTAPAASVRVDVGVHPDDDSLLKAMRKTVRNRVRQAQRHGIEVRTADGADLPVLQSLLQSTAARQGFDAYPAEYNRRLWESFAPLGQARLLVAEHEGVALSAAMVIPFGDTVLYKIGAWSGDRDAAPGANELLHWTAIAWARAAGYRYYDLEGIPVEVARAVLAGGRATPADGVAYFKLGFGGEPVVYPGTYDDAFGRVAGPAIARLIPGAQRGRKVVHRISGRSA